jgi:hypothetical protein
MMNFRTLITIRWHLSNECIFHAYFFEDSFSNIDHLKTLIEIDNVLKNFRIIEYTKTIINVDILAPVVRLPFFFAYKSGSYIIYPHETYGKLQTSYMFGIFNPDFVKVKSFYNFLEENNIITSMFNGVWCSL